MNAESQEIIVTAEVLEMIKEAVQAGLKVEKEMRKVEILIFEDLARRIRKARVPNVSAEGNLSHKNLKRERAKVHLGKAQKMKKERTVEIAKGEAAESQSMRKRKLKDQKTEKERTQKKEEESLQKRGIERGIALEIRKEILKRTVKISQERNSLSLSLEKNLNRKILPGKWK